MAASIFGENCACAFSLKFKCLNKNRLYLASGGFDEFGFDLLLTPNVSWSGASLFEKTMKKMNIWIIVIMMGGPTMSFGKEIKTPWPIQLNNKTTYVGSTEVQFQNYYEEWVNYFHSGCDLVAPLGTTVRVPANGRVQAGFNVHKINNQSRALDSVWIPYHAADLKKEDPYTFGIAITRDDGIRFEMVHIDPKTVPEEIFAAAKSNQEVKSGTIVGQVIHLPQLMLNRPYNHVHYTILRKDGVILNCVDFSEPVEDTVAPTIEAVYAVNKNGQAKLITAQSEVSGMDLSAIVIDTFDKMHSELLPLQPPYIELKSMGKPAWKWDFTKALDMNSAGFSLDVNRLIEKELMLGSGETIKSDGSFLNRKFLIRIPIEKVISGPVEIVVRDVAKNESKFSFKLKP